MSEQTEQPRQPKFMASEVVWVRAVVAKDCGDEILIDIRRPSKDRNQLPGNARTFVMPADVRRWPHDADGKPIL